MKISLLERREPFGPILARTLARHWTGQFGRPYSIDWNEGGRRLCGSGRRIQRWFGNRHLNFFALRGARPEVFGAIRREFGENAIWWRRFLQRSYTSLACREPLRSWLAQLSFSVSPDVPDGDRLLIVGGNRRIRLLYPLERKAVVVLKQGFSDDAILNELSVRTREGLPLAPRLLGKLPTGCAYEEEYFEGVPLNRIASGAARAEEAAFAALAEGLVRPTLATIRFGEYLRTVKRKLTEVIDRARLPERLAIQASRAVTAGLSSSAHVPEQSPIATALTHGDFQAGNILVNETGVRITDWEFIGRRFSGYDPLTFGLGSRSRLDLSAQIECLRTGRNPGLLRRIESWPGVGWCPMGPISSLLAYLFEELIYLLESSCEAALVSPEPQIESLLRQIEISFSAMGK